MIALPIFLLFSFINTTKKNRNFKKQKICGKVIAITDGDTFKLLLKNSTIIKIRLANIDCPEKKQPYSKAAKKFVSETIFNKEICITSLKADRYRRHIAWVYTQDSLNLNYELVKNGLAWHYKKYSKDSLLQQYEDTARNKKIGLWQEPDAKAPWEWRERKKTKK